MTPLTPPTSTLPISTQNLNHRLTPPGPAKGSATAVGISWNASAIQGSSAPVRIISGASRYRGGGYCVHR
jgi:hypothetical protein